MRINHNISSMHTQNSLFQVNRSMAKSIEKLSTGIRINSASDDAAGLGVSENLRIQTRGMEQALKNTQDAIALLNIADGALNEQADILQRMRELVVQAQNDSYTQTEREYMGKEFGSLMEELDRIASVTSYNGMQIFATPEKSGNASNGVYSNTNGAPLTAHKTTIQSDALGDVAAFGENDSGSGHHFNMMIGANYSDSDIAAYSNDGREFYSSSASNMITIAFGQMDSNALFHKYPAGAMSTPNIDGSGLFGDFSWAADGNLGDAGTDDGDWYINLVVQMSEGRNATVKDKLNMIHNLIDGGGDLSAATRGMLFPGEENAPTGLERVNQMRSRIGALINRLEHSTNNLMNQITNTQSAESLIRDTDFASETAKFTKNQILTQSSTAMLAQANTSPQMILQLLQ